MQLSFNSGSGKKAARTLADLARNEEATLDTLDLPQDAALRLMELGFVPGNSVSAGYSAPGGDPTVFRVDGSEIALRRETASRIHLRSLARN